MRKYKVVGVIILLLLGSIFFLNKEEEKKNEKKVLVVFSVWGLGDKSYNDLCYEGMLKAQEEFSLEVDYIEPTSIEEYKDIIVKATESNEYSLIVSVEEKQREGVMEALKINKEQKFILIDYKIENENVISINEKWNEQIFLNGFIAGSLLKDNEKLGVVLGVDNKQLMEGLIAFEAGALYAKENVEVLKVVLNSFNDPLKAKETAISLYNKGVSMIQQIAGESGIGVFVAASEKDKLAFGIDGNQNGYNSEHIVATGIRNIDKILFNQIKSIFLDGFKSGVYEYSIEKDSVERSRQGSTVHVNSDIMEMAEVLKEKIIKKEIIIPTTYAELEDLKNKGNLKGVI